MIETIYKEGFSVLQKIIDSPFVFTDDLILEEEYKLANAKIDNPPNTVKVYFFMVKYSIGIREFLQKLNFKPEYQLCKTKGKEYSFETHVLSLLNHIFHISVVDDMELANKCQDLYFDIQKNTTKPTDIENNPT